MSYTNFFVAAFLLLLRLLLLQPLLMKLKSQYVFIRTDIMEMHYIHVVLTYLLIYSLSKAARRAVGEHSSIPVKFALS